MLRTLLTILLLAGLSDLALPQTGRREARVDPEARVGKWKEDPERLARKLATRMSPAQYRAALKGSGMGAAIAGGTQAAGAAGWTFLGPKGAFNLSGGGHNGRIAGLSINPAGGSVVYAGACQGGLWKSDLATLGNWTSIGDSLGNPSVRAFAVDPTDPDHIFVGTGDWIRYPGAGLYETTNGGLRFLRAGDFTSPLDRLTASSRIESAHTFELGNVGFRVASVIPEPPHVFRDTAVR